MKSKKKSKEIVPFQLGKSVLPVGYKYFLCDIKARIQAAQLKASLSVNRELIVLY